jgi:transposase
MKLHANARSCPNSRALIARRVLVEGWALAAAAEAAGVSVVTARKWVRRAAAGESLEDRSSAPKRVPLRVSRGRVEAIAALRRLRMTAAEIAELLGMALSTVSLWLKRIGLGRRSRLAPPEPPNRYERGRPGELVHIDIKKLGRILAEKANRSRGPLAFLLPLKGVSMLDSPDKEFWWPEANQALFEAIKENLRPDIPVYELNHNINDEEFADAVSERMMELLEARQAATI